MRKYLKYSLLLHAFLAGVLVFWTFFARSDKKPRMEFIILPKGTSLDAVLTQEVVDAMKDPNVTPGDGKTPPKQETPEPTPDKNQEESPEPTPEATPEPTPEATPAPTPLKLDTPVPTSTPALTPKPQKTIEVAAKASPTPKKTPKPTPKSTPKPTPKPKPSPTAKPKPSATPKKSATPKTSKSTPNPTAKSTKKPAKATPKAPASAYDLAPGTGGNRFAGQDLPRQTPSNVKVGQAGAGQEVGVPGVPQGVEGAPLPLDKTQSMLSMLYTTRAKMKIQTNFTVPPGVNNPNMTCVVEWEILPDGTIQSVKVTKSTGVPQYDSCAVEALRKSANLGPLPPEFGGKSIWTSITFVYAGDQVIGATAPAN